MTSQLAAARTIVVVGNGMVGHHFVERAIERRLNEGNRIIVYGEEPRPAYDRVNLSKLFSGKTAGDLSLTSREDYERAGIELRTSARVTGIDLAQHTVALHDGTHQPFDALVLATGSRPFVPDIPGNEGPGAFVYRTIEDLELIREYASKCRRAAVIGGGLLGLEAAGALVALGLETHVIEFAPRLMPLQVDASGGAVLRARIEALGVTVHPECTTSTILRNERGEVVALQFNSDADLEVDMVVFSAGIRPRDELARQAGLEIGARGGIVIDSHCRTSDSSVFAVGECALHAQRVYGLVAPGYRMAEVAVRSLAGEDAEFTGFDMSTKLKLLGVDVGSFGDAFAATTGAKTISLFDAVGGTYKKLVISSDSTRLLGGMLVGDASAYGDLLAYVQNGLPLPEHPEQLLIPERSGASKGGLSADALPDTTNICSCHNVSKGTICETIRAQKLGSLAAVKAATKAGTGCGSCGTLVEKLFKAELKRAGVSVNNHICEHFSYSRRELFELIRIRGIADFATLVREHGRGAGCEICKPAVASILASLENEHVLARRHVGLQDTNDRFLANMQRDGTYSVVPRVAAGEITPDQLIVIGQVAKKYGLYTKITGGQRIDMFGARVEHLPEIWRELVAAGFESGHAYGKALRTVKSCVGSTWCRFGVQDSVGMALRLEHRYKGLRAPHKIKGAVSGCARECAEAQSKDFGVIATEKGYNLYVCGNGGMKPQHAQLLVADVDGDTLVRYLDRFLMYYVRTADKLQRTATWLNELEGGLEHVRRVVVEDSLGLAEELEGQMAKIVATYACEWKETLADEEKLRRFRAFVNTNEADPSIVTVTERGQIRPATPQEKASTPIRARKALPIIAEYA